MQLIAMPNTIELTVVVFCAQWCSTCREFRFVLDPLTAQYPNIIPVWLDTEDDAEVTNDIEVDNFPTVAIYKQGIPFFFGDILPQRQIIERLIRSVENTDRPLSSIPSSVSALTQHLFQGKTTEQAYPQLTERHL